jgi:hypothetical protein
MIGKGAAAAGLILVVKAQVSNWRIPTGDDQATAPPSTRGDDGCRNSLRPCHFPSSLVLFVPAYGVVSSAADILATKVGDHDRRQSSALQYLALDALWKWEARA